MRLARFFTGRLAVLAVPVLLALGGAGCNTYHYYDIHALFDPSSGPGMPGFTGASAFSVQVCVVSISGADNTTFELPLNNVPEQRCPDVRPGQNALDAGMFEYSTFTDSGTLTFTLDAFQDLAQTPGCHIGSGNVKVPATSAITTSAELHIKLQSASCVTTGQTQGDGAIILD
jgi:hypothetical protein